MESNKYSIDLVSQNGVDKLILKANEKILYTLEVGKKEKYGTLYDLHLENGKPIVVWYDKNEFLSGELIIPSCEIINIKHLGNH